MIGLNVIKTGLVLLIAMVIFAKADHDCNMLNDHQQVIAGIMVIAAFTVTVAGLILWIWGI